MSEDFRRMKSSSGTSGLVPGKAEMEMINKYTLRELSREEVFAFKAVVCDNEIDRDYEAFTAQALEELAGLFDGKTVITDHNPRSDNQCARIFSAKTVLAKGVKTSYGEAYVRLEAHCYMPREGNARLISMIETGMLKEVSVGCSLEKSTCSVCGLPYWSLDCGHLAGNKGCFVKLEGVKDAYEISFVAVPAQRAAGVVKAAAGGGEIPRWAEMHALMASMKEIREKVNKIAEFTGGNNAEPSPENPAHIKDPHIEELIRSAAALAKQTRGEYCL